MSPDDPRHGTTAGHSAGCRDLCCRRARNADERRRRKQRDVLGIQRATPAIGTQRRIRALMAIGWTSREIAEHCGWTTPQAVTELLTMRTYVYRGTAELIATAYDAMSMKLGPSDKNRRECRKKGWPPPLAWPDHRIDDPTYTPRGWQYRDPDRATKLADYDDAGLSVSEVCRRLKITRPALQKWAGNHGMSDLYRRLAEREDGMDSERGDWRSA